VFPHWPLWGRAVWGFALLVALTWLVGRLLGTPLHPDYRTIGSQAQLWGRFVEAAWWLVAARSAVGITRLMVVLEHRPRETQIISDLMAGAIYVVGALAVVNFVLDVPIGTLLATSGVIAIVLGLALQSTLQDVFSGIAVGIERPYKAGDLIWVEGGIEGHVTQVNWRSTHIVTGSNNIAVVPNSVIAKARLVNHSLPSTIRSDTIVVQLDARVPAARGMAALVAAVKAARLPLAAPAPSVARTGLRGDGAEYEINFSVPSSNVLGAARSEILGQVQGHLQHAGIALAVAGLADVPEIPVPTPADLLQQSDLFGVMPAPEREQLAAHLTEIYLPPGKTLIKQGENPNALFVIAEGTVEITTSTPGRSHVVHRLSPGGSLGAIGLITGAPYAATATALTPVRAYRLDKESIAAAILARPELVTGLEDLARRGQEALRNDAAAHEEDTAEHPEMLLSRMRSFLRKLAVVETK
jgi:small-conductance mechanosensitive channel/CRP-like cAMP-binding protein